MRLRLPLCALLRLLCCHAACCAQILHAYQITHHIQAPFKVAGQRSVERAARGPSKQGARSNSHLLAELAALTLTRSESRSVCWCAVDGEFLQSALAGQIMLKEQIPKMLQEERTTVFVTPCIDNWLRLKGSAYSGALHIAQSLAHLKCRHDKGFGQ